MTGAIVSLIHWVESAKLSVKHTQNAPISWRLRYNQSLFGRYMV